jgi:5-hydroxyisourate hydrolase
MSISTHVLDLVTGRPARGVRVTLERAVGQGFAPVAAGTTDDDGRIKELVAKGAGAPGIHRIRFDTGAWFASTGTPTFYPWVELAFEVVDAEAHHHVPLLLGPYGFSTYRGS